MLLYLILTTAVVCTYGSCTSRCNWSPWKSWSSCSRACGGGTRWRSRPICCKASVASDLSACMSDCGRDDNYYYNGCCESGLCNTDCYNGGTLIRLSRSSGHCSCNKYYDGVCCEKEKIKEPGGKGQCSVICNWTPWEPWSTCSVSCGGGGEQERIRSLCCLEDYGGFQTCAMICGTDVRARAEKRSCGNSCLLGGTIKPSGFGCDCLNRTFGHCCDQLLPGCTAFPTDVIFVLDSSASQTKEQFHRQLDFVNEFLDHVNISKEEFQVAVITYSTDATVDVSFNQSTDSDTLRRLIKDIKFRPGATFTDKGLNVAREVARKSERRIGMVTLTYAFVLTDGMSNKRMETRLAATRLKNADVHVVAIGIGKEVSHQELKDIASPGDSFSPSYVFSVGDFNALNTLLKQLVHVTCDDCSVVSHKSDILFLLDESNQMTEAEFQLSVDIMTSIVQSTDHIGEPYGTQFALVQLTSKLDTIIQFLNDQVKNDLQVKLQTLYRRQNGFCETDKHCSEINITSAVDSIVETFFVQSGRQNARRCVVILSNGRFRNSIAVKAELSEIHKSSNVRLFVIGPGLDVDMNGLLSLAKEANHVYVTIDDNDLSKLDVLQSEFSYNVCKGQ